MEFCHFPVPRILITHSEKEESLFCKISNAVFSGNHSIRAQRSAYRERARELDEKVTHIKNSWLIS